MTTGLLEPAIGSQSKGHSYHSSPRHDEEAVSDVDILSALKKNHIFSKNSIPINKISTIGYLKMRHFQYDVMKTQLRQERNITEEIRETVLS